MEDNEKMFINVLFQIPMTQEGVEYMAVKDFCKWNDMKPLSRYVPLMMNLGRFYINKVRDKG